MIDDSGLLNLDIVAKSDKTRKVKNIKKFTQKSHEECSNEEVENTKKSIRDTLYGKIDVSVKTMDIVITVLMIALFTSIILGITI